MNIVTTTTQAPGFCIFTKDVEGPFLDTGRWIDQIDPYGYVHVPFVEEMGRAVGMVPAGEVEALKERVDVLGRALNDTRTLLEAMQTVKNAEEVLSGSVTS